MPTVSKVAALHGALWNTDPWYRWSWYVGPLSMAFLVCGWIVAQPQQTGKSADIPWAVPIPRPVAAARPTNYGQGTLPPDVAKHFAPPGWTPPAIKPAGENKPSEPAATAQPAAPAVVLPRKAVLYEDDAAGPQDKRSEGTVNWRTEEDASVADLPKQLAIKAEIEVPERKIKMTLSIRRNTDASLPASHLAELSVTLPPDFSGGGIASVREILLKPNEQAKGNPLRATAVKVNDGLFLIGLSNDAGERWRNMHLLEYNAWIDIVVVYNNEHHTIVALEKGDIGQRVFQEAIAAWLK